MIKKLILSLAFLFSSIHAVDVELFVKNFEDIIKTKELSSGWIKYKAIQLFRSFKKDNDDDAINKLIDLIPNEAEPYVLRSILLTDKKKYEQALVDINHAIYLCKEFYTTKHIKGLIFYIKALICCFLNKPKTAHIYITMAADLGNVEAIDCLLKIHTGE